MIKILFIGPQGSGKSTQAKLLAEYLNIPYISTGDIFREISTKDSEGGKRIKEILDEGRLVDDETTSELVKQRVKQIDCQNGFILDGYPRTLKQIELFNPEFDRVFYLELTDEQASKRLMKRRREDDTEQLIAARLKNYHMVTDPILEYFRRKGLLRPIDGSGTIEQIQSELRRALDE